jgi:hypothetical protein
VRSGYPLQVLALPFRSGCGLSTAIPHAGYSQQSRVQGVKNSAKKDSKELGKERKQLLYLHPARENTIVEKSEKLPLKK